MAITATTTATIPPCGGTNAAAGAAVTIKRTPAAATTATTTTKTATARAPRSTPSPRRRVVTDANILQALAEGWDPATCVSPGYDDDDTSNSNTAPVFRPVRGAPSVLAMVRRPRTLWERVAFAWVADCRDVGLFNVAVLATVTLWPSVIGMYLFGKPPPWWWVAAHVAATVAQMGSFTLAMHVSGHRPCWAYRWMDPWIPAVLAPLFGQTFYTYHFHHMKMHHVEDNGLKDCSSTLLLQRDSAADFFSYFFRFFFLIIIELPSYFFKSGQTGKAVKSFVGEAVSITAMVTLASVNFWATFAAFILPLVVVRFAMMSGNWVQHSFLTRTDPLGGGLHNSITVINSFYNWQAFNDGYHANHHLNPRRHWSEYPLEFLRQRARYTDAGAIVVRDVDYWAVFFLLMRGRYDLLAEKVVPTVGLGAKIAATVGAGPKAVEAALREKTRRFSLDEILALKGGKAAKAAGAK